MTLWNPEIQFQILMQAVLNQVNLKNWICGFNRLSRVKIKIFFVTERQKYISIHWWVPLENSFLTRHLAVSKYALSHLNLKIREFHVICALQNWNYIIVCLKDTTYTHFEKSKTYTTKAALPPQPNLHDNCFSKFLFYGCLIMMIRSHSRHQPSLCMYVHMWFLEVLYCESALNSEKKVLYREVKVKTQKNSPFWQHIALF